MLFVLPFDHRATFAKELLGFSYPNLTPAQKKAVSDYKLIVWEGFLRARATLANLQELAILVDEEFGASILKDATRKKIPFALSVEKSGQNIFDFEYGTRFMEHIKKWKPAYAKALVRYNVQDIKGNRTQNARLKALSDFCKKSGVPFMIEPLMTGKGSRFEQLTQTVKEMTTARVFPALWKVEAVDTAAEWKQLRALTDAPIIFLGRGDTKAHVQKWLKTAAKSGVVDGFAVGRTVFLKPLMDFRDKKLARAQTVDKIAQNLTHFINLWKKYART